MGLIKDFFRAGGFWSNLESTISEITKRLSLHKELIHKSTKNDKILAEYIKKQQIEINALKERTKLLEEKLSNLHIATTSIKPDKNSYHSPADGHDD